MESKSTVHIVSSFEEMFISNIVTAIRISTSASYDGGALIIEQNRIEIDVSSERQLFHGAAESAACVL